MPSLSVRAQAYIGALSFFPCLDLSSSQGWLFLCACIVCVCICDTNAIFEVFHLTLV